MFPRCLKMATRNRAASPKANPKSHPPTSCNSCWQRSGVMLFIRAEVSVDSSTLVLSGTMCPPSRSIGFEPTVRCRSLAFWVTTVCNNLSISNVPMSASNLSRRLRQLNPRP